MTVATEPRDIEIARVNAASGELISEYLAWSPKAVYGDTYNMMYGDIIDFVNFRVETAESCLQLIEQDKIADALGLCRALLENYLLLTLLCGGTKYFQLLNLEDSSPEEFAAKLKEEEATQARRQSEGKPAFLEVAKYPRAKRHIMYVSEGLKDTDMPGFLIPLHYFQFKAFHPQTMRLNEEDYFTYYEHPPQLKKALKGHRAQANTSYRHYLSYDALIQCLSLNEIVDTAAEARIEAHYTFLGQFLHPTHDAARSLRVRSSVHDGKPAVGMNAPYGKTAKLLASLYVAYLLAGIFDEVASLLDNAPSKYVKTAGTTELHAAAAQVASSFPYFWFIFNKPPLYDKFIHAIHHATDDELKQWGGYAGTPDALVGFDQHIFAHLQQAISGFSNRRCGHYKPPI